MTDIDLTGSRAKQVQPQGFVPSHLAVPMLRDSRTTALEYVADGLGEIRLRAAMVGGKDVLAADLADQIGAEATRLQRLVKALATGALVAAFLAAGLVVGGPSTGRAEAAEAPQPDPVATQTVRVTLGAAPMTVYVRATAYTPVARGWYCASIDTARGRIGGTCSIGRTFPIPVTINPRTFPVGRTFAQVVDDASDVAVSNVTFDARRPSKFGVGYYEDRGQGDLYVRVPVFLYSPVAGRWVPQVQSPVQLQELMGRTWRVRATLTTNPPGLAVGVVHLGGGVHIFRIVRPAGRTVWATTGTVRTVNLLTEPIDVD